MLGAVRLYGWQYFASGRLKWRVLEHFQRQMHTFNTGRHSCTLIFITLSMFLKLPDCVCYSCSKYLTSLINGPCIWFLSVGLREIFVLLCVKVGTLLFLPQIWWDHYFFKQPSSIWFIQPCSLMFLNFLWFVSLELFHSLFFLCFCDLCNGRQALPERRQATCKSNNDLSFTVCKKSRNSDATVE